MPKPFTEWTVLPHGRLSRIDDNLLSVVGDLPMPLGEFPRRMTVCRLKDSRLIIFSAIALDDREMVALEDFGIPTYLIVPNDIHRMDAKIWKDRYRQLTVIAPKGVRKKVDEVVHVDQVDTDFGDTSVEFVTVPGTDDHEAALVITGESGSTLVVNDLIWNVGDLPGFGGFLFRMLGLTGQQPKIPGLVELRAIKDKVALQMQLEAWAHMPDLKRIIVSHGNIITRNPAQVLLRLAESLA